jgi:hypothetical protein
MNLYAVPRGSFLHAIVGNYPLPIVPNEPESPEEYAVLRVVGAHVRQS